jgi:fluoroquinolone transport system permease protein
MTRLLSLIQLDFILMWRNKIILVAAIITLLYMVVLQVLPQAFFNMVLTTLIFTDPVMIGFLFIGAMVLFEKNGNTLQAVAVSPVRSVEYLWSKAITLTIVAVLAGLLMAIAGKGINFNIILFLAAAVFSSLLFVFIGFVGVSMVKTFNQYFIIIPLFMIPGFLPFLNYYGITDTLAFYLIPTQAALLLFNAAFQRETIIDAQWIYCLIMIPLSTYLAFIWAQYRWNKVI